jgi:hypothetical protein
MSACCQATTRERDTMDIDSLCEAIKLDFQRVECPNCGRMADTSIHLSTLAHGQRPYTYRVRTVCYECRYYEER